MKSRYKILKSDDNLYFLTLNVLLKIPVFTNSSYMHIILENFKSFTAKKLIERLHFDEKKWILQLMLENKSDYKQESTYQFWQGGNHPKQIPSIEMFNQKVEYIHQNPVKRGLIENEEDWLYSSARYFSGTESVFCIDEIE